MGAVHGVMFKYVGLASLGLATYATAAEGASIVRGVGLYVALLNAVVSVGFVTGRGASWVLAKDPSTGAIPWWALVAWAGFVVPTWCYTRVHTSFGKRYHGVLEANEILEGWWLGGRYADRVKERPARFAGVVDLTCELPERLRGATDSYKLVAVWDGTPPSPERIDDAAAFCVDARAKHNGAGHVLVHCAHGRGRSTTVFVAALVKAGKFDDWRDAFAACKRRRPCVKLNRAMRDALDAWQREYHHLKPHTRENNHHHHHHPVPS
mmetsp:Transcript_20338/g.81297  ORF Transcript_20338/g.81297 Transcript_20338/m.81297 type:complete len:266 (-) Transcript_20338:2896-3693(-)